MSEQQLSIDFSEAETTTCSCGKTQVYRHPNTKEKVACDIELMLCRDGLHNRRYVVTAESKKLIDDLFELTQKRREELLRRQEREVELMQRIVELRKQIDEYDHNQT